MIPIQNGVELDMFKVLLEKGSPDQFLIEVGDKNPNPGSMPTHPG